MTACTFCSARTGKRACPALGGEICPRCCGKHRLVEIECPSECRWLGGLAVVRDGTSGFTRAEYSAARDKLTAYVFSPRCKEQHRDALALLLDSDERSLWAREEEPFPGWMEPMLAPYLGHGHRGADDRRAVDRFLASHGRALPRGEAAALVALQQAWPSLFEITSVRVGAGFTVRDLILGEPHDVREVTASATVHRGHVLLAWLMRAGDAMELAGDAMEVPRALVEGVRAALADALERGRDEHPGRSPRELLGHRADVALAALRDGFARTPRPRLTTTLGEALLFCEAHYEVVEPDTVRTRLHTRGDLQPDGNDGDDSPVPAFTWIDPAPNPMLGDGPTVLGRIRIERNELILETHARERLSRGRAMLESVLGSAIVHRADAFTDPEALLRDRHAHASAPMTTLPSSVPPEIEAEIVGRFLGDHYRRWLDEAVPALGDRTPRKAAKTPKGREQVARLLDDLERDSQAQPGAGPALWNELRRELGIAERVAAGEGLTYDGDHAPDPAAWLEADEDVRIRAIRAHHEACAGHPEVPNATLHAQFHLIAENQLAARVPTETVDALTRLIAAGTTRHEAVHAVMSVVATEVHAMLETRRRYDLGGVARALSELRVADWIGTMSRSPHLAGQS